MQQQDQAESPRAAHRSRLTATDLPSICQRGGATGGRSRVASSFSVNTNLSSGHTGNHPAPPTHQSHPFTDSNKKKKKNLQFHGAIVDHFNSNPSPIQNDRKAIQPSTLVRNPISYCWTVTVTLDYNLLTS